MKKRRAEQAVTLLRRVLGVVVLAESAAFAFSAGAAHAFARTGLPAWVRPALGGAEMLAVLLFLVPPTAITGGYLLIAIFGLAAIVHLLHGWYDVGALLVYAAAAWVVTNYRAESRMRDS